MRLIGFALLILGCDIEAMKQAEVGGTAARRASIEMPCPRSELTARERPELSAVTWEVVGCGKVARYSCRYEHMGLNDYHWVCVPEASSVRAAPASD